MLRRLQLFLTPDKVSLSRCLSQRVQTIQNIFVNIMEVAHSERYSLHPQPYTRRRHTLVVYAYRLKPRETPTSGTLWHHLWSACWLQMRPKKSNLQICPTTRNKARRNVGARIKHTKNGEWEVKRANVERDTARHN